MAEQILFPQNWLAEVLSTIPQEVNDSVKHLAIPKYHIPHMMSSCANAVMLSKRNKHPSR